MAAEKQTPSLTEQAKEALATLAPDVSRSDKKAAVTKLSISYATINRYLAGDVRQTSTAEKIIKFFGERIEKRRKAIAS